MYSLHAMVSLPCNVELDLLDSIQMVSTVTLVQTSMSDLHCMKPKSLLSWWVSDDHDNPGPFYYIQGKYHVGILSHIDTIIILNHRIVNGCTCRYQVYWC